MARVKSGRTTKLRHRKILKMAKGYYGAKSIRFRMANQAVMKSLKYAYVGRKDKKSNFRKLWIARINAAARANGTTYSKLMNGMKKANIAINRKMLSDLAIVDAKAFTNIVKLAVNVEKKA
jgi:large subunit ribosomal protein L20